MQCNDYRRKFAWTTLRFFFIKSLEIQQSPFDLIIRVYEHYNNPNQSVLTYWITTVAFPVLQVAGISCLWALSLLFIKKFRFTNYFEYLNFSDNKSLYGCRYNVQGSVCPQIVVTKNDENITDYDNMKIKINPKSTV